MIIVGLCPHGERTIAPERGAPLPENRAAAKAPAFHVAVVMYRPDSDWAKHQLSGIIYRFGKHRTAETQMIDCAFCP
jgi:hypothetical protein